MNEIALRQMVYVVIKLLAGVAEDVIMVTSSVMKDVSSTSDVVYRPNAIRALARIIDASTVQAIERLMKTCIVDRTSSVSVAALVSSYHLHALSRDTIRRWASEAQEAISISAKSGGGGGLLSSSSSMIPIGAQASYISQYHAVGLLYLIRQTDRLAITRIIQQFGSAGSGSSNLLKSPHGIVLLCRFVAKIIEDDPNMRKPMYTLLEGWLRHRSDMVNFEAARVICEMRDVTDAEVSPAISILQLFLTSPRIICRFTAIRILNKFAMHRPQLVDPCNPEIENLITDPNRSIATYAITTLLKTGNEASVDRLMKQIEGFMADITEEFKIIVVDAIRSLCLKFPNKQATMLEFLSGFLRDEGGYEFKRSVCEAMFDLIKYVPESKEAALVHLCEFIEDCEYTKLAVRILHLLGVEGPEVPSPGKYIRYIYNRVVLENSIVRAAAVTALAKFGVGDAQPAIKSSIRVLLTRCLDDTDDEVRDRAILNLRLLDKEAAAMKIIKNDSVFSLPTLEQQLVLYISNGEFSQIFDLSMVPAITRQEADAEALKTHAEKVTASVLPDASTIEEKPVEVVAPRYDESLSKIAQFKSYGPVLKSSTKPIELTEPETEYMVQAVKHIFKDHIVLQFDVANTLPDTLLESVSVISLPDGEDLGINEEFIIPCEKISVDDGPRKIYVSFVRDDPTAFILASFANTLKFTSREIDPTTGEPEDRGYDDEYEIDGLDLVGGDYLIPTQVPDFGKGWDTMGEETEESEIFQLGSIKSIQEACQLIIEVLSLQPLEGTATPFSNSTHTMKLSGRSTSGAIVLVLVKMAWSAKSGVTLQVSARSEDNNTAQLVIACVV